MLEDSKEQTEGRYIAAAQVGAWLSMGILNIVVTWLALPMSGVDVRLMLHLYDVGQLLAVGLAAAVIVVVWRRFGPQRAFVGYAMLAFLSIAISQFVLRNDLRGAASILGLSSWQLWASNAGLWRRSRWQSQSAINSCCRTSIWGFIRMGPGSLQPCLRDPSLSRWSLWWMRCQNRRAS
jgi:hypothetical protein